MEMGEVEQQKVMLFMFDSPTLNMQCLTRHDTRLKLQTQGWATVVFYPESTTAPEQIKLGRLLTNSSPLLIPNYMTKIVVSDIFQYIR